MKKFIFTILTLFISLGVFAQSKDQPEMADVFRSDGKIYVVIATIAIVFIGLAVWLFAIDRRLKKVENEK